MSKCPVISHGHAHLAWPLAIAKRGTWPWRERRLSTSPSPFLSSPLIPNCNFPPNCNNLKSKQASRSLRTFKALHIRPIFTVKPLLSPNPSQVSRKYLNTSSSLSTTSDPSKAMANLIDLGASPRSAMRYNPHAGYFTLARDPYTIVVCVDGACRNNGRPGARAGYGVWFGPNSDLNQNGLLRSDLKQTNQVAEAKAAEVALQTATSLINVRASHATRLVILSDSAYLVNAMTDWIYKWKQNGWKGANGDPVVNKEIFQVLDRLIANLNRAQVEVSMCRVERAENVEADMLVNEAFL